MKFNLQLWQVTVMSLHSTRSQSALFDAPFWLRLRQSQKKCRAAYKAPARIRFAQRATTLFFRLPRFAQKCAVKNAHILTALSVSMWGVSSTSIARHGVGYGLAVSYVSLGTYQDTYILPGSYEELYQRIKDDFQKLKTPDDVVSINVTFSDKTSEYRLSREFFAWAGRDMDGAMALLMKIREALGNQPDNRSFMLGIALDEYIGFMNKALLDRKIDAKKAAIYAGRIWFYAGLRWGKGNDEAKHLMTLIKGLLSNFTGYDLKDEDANNVIAKLFKGDNSAANKKNFISALDGYARYLRFRKKEKSYVNGLFDDTQIVINRPEGKPPILAVK